MPGNGKVNPAAFMGKDAMDQGNIVLFDGPIFELPGKSLMGHIVFCHKQELMLLPILARKRIMLLKNAWLFAAL